MVELSLVISDQVLCSAANGVFVGTWFSTFSGYITRMRGYLGYKDKSVYYGDKEHRYGWDVEETEAVEYYPLSHSCFYETL